MDSLFKKGKEIVRETRSILASPEGRNSQYRGGPYQPFPSSQGLSPQFQQAPTSTPAHRYGDWLSRNEQDVASLPSNQWAPIESTYGQLHPAQVQYQNEAAYFVHVSSLHPPPVENAPQPLPYHPPQSAPPQTYNIGRPISQVSHRPPLTAAHSDPGAEGYPPAVISHQSYQHEPASMSPAGTNASYLRTQAGPDVFNMQSLHGAIGYLDPTSVHSRPGTPLPRPMQEHALAVNNSNARLVPSPYSLHSATSPTQCHQVDAVAIPPLQTSQLIPSPQYTQSKQLITPQAPAVVQEYQQLPTVHLPVSSRPTTEKQDESAPSVLRIKREGNEPVAKKILSLDGGGVRGLASLVMLKHLMNRLEDQRGGRLEPWQEFDMIAGTSTGGLIAIMLGRLRMSVDECIDAYTELSREIFTPVHSKVNVASRAVAKFKAEGKFESKPLEDCVKRMLRDRGLSESELLKDDSQDAPKVFVCAVQGSNSDAVVVRSYKSGSGEYDDLYRICKIWEAARATSAASTFFDPIKIGYQNYVDGALRYNNPIEKVDQESRELWPSEDRLIISIGTGSAPGPNLLGNAVKLMQTLIRIVTDSEDENNRFRRRNRLMIEDDRLYRFNVLHGLADVKLEEWDAIEEISAHTGTYLRSPDTAREFERCAASLKNTGQRLGYIAGEELLIYQKIQKLSAIFCEFCEDCHRGIPYNNKLFVCVECQMFTCSDCHDVHDTAHIRGTLRFDLIQWMPKLPGVDSTAPCRHCAQDSKIRWECKSCDYALCRKCVGYHERRVEFFSEHRKEHPAGRYFIATYPPFWTTLSSWVNDPCPCLDMQPAALSAHCERCHRYITVSMQGFWCRTCSKEFGVSQWLCQSCLTQDMEHRKNHRFITADIVLDPAGPEALEKAKEVLWGCHVCPNLRIAQGREDLHEHDQLIMFVSPMIIEMMRTVNYRNCNRAIAKSSSVNFTESITWNCTMCLTALGVEQLGSVCINSDCGASFCSSCLEAQRINHRHTTYRFVIKRPPQNNWNQIICCYCAQAYSASMVQGLWCADCNNHFLCLQCLYNSIARSKTIADGLPHQKILKQCKVKHGWILYMNE